MATTEKGIYYPNDYSEAADIPADMQTMAESVDTAIGNAEDSIGGQISTLEQTVQTNTQDISDIQTEQTTQNTNIQTNTNNVTALQTTVSYLEGLIPTDEASGEEITLTDSVRYPFKEFNVGGNTKQATLPDTYQAVDYIESSGTQYIDTGVTGEAQWNLRVQGNRIYQGTQIILSRASNAGYWFGIIDQTSGGQYGFGTTNKSNVLGTTLADIILNTSNTKISGNVNNVNIPERAITNSDYINNSYWLLNANTSSSSTFFAEVKLHYAKCYQNNVLVRDFVPCYRKSDNVVGLYDLVNNVFYTNAGTGSFTYGAVVTLPNPNTPIEVQNVSGNVNVKVENKNLFDKNNANVLTGTYFNSSSILSGVGNRCIYIPIKPNTTYTIQKMVQITTASNRLRLGTTTNIPAIGVTINNFINLGNGTTGTSLTITTGANDKYLVAVVYYTDSQTTFNAMINSIQIEESSTATAYEPYSIQTATLHLPEGMEMCKIGDYADGFVYSGGKWYKNGVIKKRVLNGTEAWSSVAMAYTTGYYFTDSDIKANTGGAKLANALCSHLKQVTPDANWSSSTKAQNFAILQGSKIIRVAMGETVSNLTQFKNWLGENNITIECELATPVLEEITDTTLISDLNNLKDLYSYKGTTYISSSNEPSPVFEVVYRKSLG